MIPNYGLTGIINSGECNEPVLNGVWFEPYMQGYFVLGSEITQHLAWNDFIDPITRFAETCL